MFFYVTKQLSGEILHEELTKKLNTTILVDGLLCQVKSRKKALPEIMAYIREIEIDNVMDNDMAQDIEAMYYLFNNIAEILNNKNARDDIDGPQMEF